MAQRLDHPSCPPCFASKSAANHHRGAAVHLMRLSQSRPWRPVGSLGDMRARAVWSRHRFYMDSWMSKMFDSMEEIITIRQQRRWPIACVHLQLHGLLGEKGTACHVTCKPQGLRSAVGC